MAQLDQIELTNDMPVSTQAQLMEMETHENVEHQSIDVEHNNYNIKHQLEDTLPESSTKNSNMSFTKLNAKATPYIPKEKGCTVTFAKMTFRNLDIGSNHDTFPTPPSNRQKVNTTKRIVSNSKA
ncbi:uncharacterized protein OCT59_017424 [Rhizophagus irregularis]|uniref:Uncharacterized protein n=2 Tax=Rhizophagus irregularis TaxID=588596 RepID=A0A015LCR2_RHIIW|nr:hypothetical protein RirG_251440 [Rhizophagus irregularis DAOM 197198w]UZO25143.1 hypothetical protein OCT59_017424 [Rhizophagus irregularis]GBC46243.1 hypothetical protein GLOIN_2v1774860 [Rhizophagus irregularis DAOM 181602=DAOM 197198]GBC46247.1 hypothetical protein GLOIN_2v1774860 [Rhizophagus irregularis DAOM 181602=DAOM 197198]